MTTPEDTSRVRQDVHPFEMSKEEMEREFAHMLGRSEEACRRSVERVARSRHLMAGVRLDFHD